MLVSTFLVNQFFWYKYMFPCYYPAGKYWSQERPEEVPSKVPRMSPKHPVWPFRGRYHLTLWESSNLTFQGRSESTSRGRILVGVLSRSQWGSVELRGSQCAIHIYPKSMMSMVNLKWTANLLHLNTLNPFK